jgi:hypothetical protein
MLYIGTHLLLERKISFPTHKASSAVSLDPGDVGKRCAGKLGNLDAWGTTGKATKTLPGPVVRAGPGEGGVALLSLTKGCRRHTPSTAVRIGGGALPAPTTAEGRT